MIFVSNNIQSELWEIHEPWFSEHANLYVIKGSHGTLLIDTGIGFEHLPSWLASQGLTPDIVVITHTHFDHCGGLHQFPTDTIFLTQKQALNIQTSTHWGLSYLKSDQLSSTCGHASKADTYQPIAPPNRQTLGSKIDLGSYTLSVIPVPGHTDDSVIFFEEKTGWLFTGDTLYRGKLYHNFPNANVKEWQKSLEKIVKLKPKIIFPGHNEIFDASLLPGIIEASLNQLTTAE